MHRLLTFAFIPMVCSLGLSEGVSAQTIQQPVVRTFGATTTLSVPDRGTAFIGGVGQSAYGRRNAGFGPLRGSSNIGRESSGASLTTTVTIHDFQAMDEYLLRSANAQSTRNRSLNGVAANAYEQLTGSEVSAPPVNSPPQRRPMHESGSSSSSRADRFFQLGLAAESRGQTGVARLHFQTAVRLGSQAAVDRLRRMSNPR